MSDINDFVIENGVLKKYNGSEQIIKVPDGVTSIDNFAFNGCTGLTSVEIPSSVTSIGDHAFESSEVEACPIENCQNLKEIGEKAFAQSGLQTLHFSKNSLLMAIGNMAFAGCSLISLEIPASVMSIGDRAFAKAGLTKITLSNSLETIGASAFSGCSSLVEVLIPKSVKTIGTQAFYGCSRLEIYCQVSSQPSGWNSTWNQRSGSVYNPVFWNYGGETDVTRDGYTWMLLADGSGVSITEYDGLDSEVVSLIKSRVIP